MPQGQPYRSIRLFNESLKVLSLIPIALTLAP